jgi:hypothetical protein
MLEERLQLSVALSQRSFVLGSQLGACGAQLFIDSLELSATLVKLDQYRHFAAQDLLDDRHRDVVDRAELVALQPVELADVHRGDEDDRRAFKPRMLAHQTCHLEAVHLRHVHVEQDRRELLLEQPFQGLGAGKRPDALHSQPVQDGLVRQQPGRLIVHEQDAGTGRSRTVFAGPRRLACGGLTCLQRVHWTVRRTCWAWRRVDRF